MPIGAAVRRSLPEVVAWEALGGEPAASARGPVAPFFRNRSATSMASRLPKNRRPPRSVTSEVANAEEWTMEA